MVTKTKTKLRGGSRVVWLWGDKKKGVSVHKLNYKPPKWRVVLWLNGERSHTVDYFDRGEALLEGRAYVREYKKTKRGWWS